MKGPFAITLGILCLSCNAADQDHDGDTCVRGIEGRIAVFATTNAQRDAVAWLPAETVFSIRGQLSEGTWQAIEPPDSVSVWIYRDLVRNGVVVTDKSRVRSGAGLNYRAIAVLNKGQTVAVRATYGDWLKIKPPPGIDFWVLRDQVEPLAMQPAREEQPDAYTSFLTAFTNTPTLSVPSNDVTIVAPAAPVIAERTPPPPELNGAVLDERKEQGKSVRLSGTLDWGGVGSFQAPFCLVARQADGDTRPVCHLFAPELTYKPHIGEAITLEGTLWHVKGSDLPIVIPASFQISE